MNNELYVTEIEQEAYDLGGQLALSNVRSHVAHKADKYGKPYYVVVVDAPEAYQRALTVRRRMFGS